MDICKGYKDNTRIMGHKDKEFNSPCGYTQKGSEWKIKYTHFAKQIIHYSLLVFNYIEGLTAYEAWQKCNGCWPSELGNNGICPAFHECTFEQLNPYPYLKEYNKVGTKALIPVLEVVKHDTWISNGHSKKNPEA